MSEHAPTKKSRKRTGKSSIQVNEKTSEQRVHAFCDDAIAEHDATQLSFLIKRGEVSALEVTEAAIARCRRVNPQLNAIASERFDQAALDARSKPAHPDRIFDGIPTLIKDNAPAKGLPTAYGTAAICAKPERRDGPYTRQFRSLGFNILGKSTLPEFGFNATTEPVHDHATRNPWNPAYSAGASSGGSAALVAAGAIPIAHGNDGGGSIRIPAACCGLVGLKPSRGRHVNSTQARALPINIVSEGVLTRSVQDTARFHFHAQTHYSNPGLPRIPLIEGPAKQRLRIGYFSDSVAGFETDRDTRRVFEETLKTLSSLGHRLQEIPFPVKPDFAEHFSLYWGMMAYLVKKTGKASIAPNFRASKLDALSHGLARHYQQNMLKTPYMLYRLKRHAHAYNAAFETQDVLLSPVLTQTVRPLGELHPEVPYDELFERLTRYVGFTPMANVSGAPAISLPMGLCDNGLPVGMHFSAAPGREQTLLELAFELEEAQGWPHIQHQTDS